MEYSNLMAETLAPHAFALRSAKDLDPLLESIGDNRFVLLGEASHGTHEFYTWRAHLTKRLIQEKGFNFVAVEGDWPDCYEINRYVKGYKDAHKRINEIVRHFKRWPTFMWGNFEICSLAKWMHQHNIVRPKDQRVGFYGLDVYSLLESLESIVDYMKKVDGDQAVRSAENALACFQRVIPVMGREDVGQAYGMAATLTPYSCRDEVINLLVNVRKEALKLGREPDEEAMENQLSAELNAEIALDAEKYYRIMVDGSDESWNVRDTHMMDTLEKLVKHYGPQSKGIVWAHNTHNGDARATDMARGGLINIGQLVRERFGRQNTMLIGLGTHSGTVMAGKKWGAPMEIMPIAEGAPGSWEDVCHKASKGRDCFFLPQALGSHPVLEKRIGHRAIGVVFNPKVEYRNYVPSIIPQRYDAFMFFDKTKAVHALDIQPDVEHYLPETYPWGV